MNGMRTSSLGVSCAALLPLKDSSERGIHTAGRQALDSRALHGRQHLWYHILITATARSKWSDNGRTGSCSKGPIQPKRWLWRTRFTLQPDRPLMLEPCVTISTPKIHNMGTTIQARWSKRRHCTVHDSPKAHTLILQVNQHPCPALRSSLCYTDAFGGPHASGRA